MRKQYNMERGVQILSARWRQAFRMEVKYKSKSGSQLNREYGDIGMRCETCV